MGTTYSKIDERERVRTYKVVNLVEAREQFAKLIATSTDCKLPQKFQTLPVMRNFWSDCAADFYNLPLLQMLSTGGVEVDGRYPQWFTLYHILRPGTKTQPTIVPKNYYLGLDKEQYDALYPVLVVMPLTATSTAISTA